MNSIVSQINSNNSPFLEEFNDSHEFEIPPQVEFLKKGEKKNIEFVVFSSLECPGCKTFNDILDLILEKHGDQISVEFRNYPLGTACNPFLEYDMQPNSCNAAHASIAAGFQNKFWEYHDILFSLDVPIDDTTLLRISQDLGLDIKKWESDRRSDEVNKILLTDILIAGKLKVLSTPSVFVNGKKLNEITYDIVDKIIHSELSKN